MIHQAQMKELGANLEVCRTWNSETPGVSQRPPPQSEVGNFPSAKIPVQSRQKALNNIASHAGLGFR